jgi:hypothetical protein
VIVRRKTLLPLQLTVASDGLGELELANDLAIMYMLEYRQLIVYF